MAFQITYTEGRTDSWSTTLGFKIGVSEKIEAGFLFAGEETDVSFETSFENSFSGDASEGLQISRKGNSASSDHGNAVHNHYEHRRLPLEFQWHLAWRCREHVDLQDY